MALRIDRERFQIAQEAFCRYMEAQSGGVPFTNFRHRFLVADEIEYKRVVYGGAKRALQLDKWPSWLRETPENIIQATKDACAPGVSANLLEHRYGWDSSSEAPLYRVRGDDQVRGLARQLYDFFSGGPTAPDDFGPRLDAFAQYLREHRLSCKWSFVAYLAFLLDPDRYFPVAPGRLDKLLEYYGVEQKISGYVTWKRYAVLLELADVLRSKLAVYGQVTMLEIQSYMWVVSGLIEKGIALDQPVSWSPDLDSVLASRVQQAKERERIGLCGEQFVFSQECQKLRSIGHPDLPERVRMVSVDDEGAGFDVLSFDVNGEELHIEVKTTVRSQDQDIGFWLSENERMQAEQDDKWCLFRVCSIDSSPTLENLGNVVQQPAEGWQLSVSTWSVRRTREEV